MCIICQSATAAAAMITAFLPVSPDVASPSDGVVAPSVVMTEAAESLPTIAGKRCVRPRLVRTVAGVRYRCTPIGRSLKWRRVGTASGANSSMPSSTTSAPTTTSTTVEPYRQPTVTSSSADLCRLRDQSTQRRTFGNLLAGFPMIETNFASRGVFTFALVPIDFSDLPGDSGVIERVGDQMQLVTDWYDMVSEGRVRIEWRVHRNWVRVPGDSGSYAMNRSRSDDNKLANAAFAAADPSVDFGGVRAVAFVLPAGQTFMAEGVQGFLHSQFGSEGGYATAEGRVYNYMIAGAYFDRQYKNYWSYWAHETGHMFPLPDLYDQNTQWWIGKQTEIPGGPFSGFDMMAAQDGPSRTLSTWLRFVMGWLADSQVFCKPFTELTEAQVTLVPIDDRKSGMKTVLVPLSDSKLLVVESRRANTKFDCEGTGTSTPTWRARNGVIVYTADLTLGHGEGFQALVAPASRGLQSLSTCSSPRQYDAILEIGDVVTSNGVRVRVLGSGLYDTVEITRL
jgi:M6 family metalloprotease-like protein